LKQTFVAEVGVDHVTARQRVFHIDDDRKLFPCRFDLLRGVLGLGAGFGDDGRDPPRTCQHARSIAIGCCGADLMPFR